MNAAEFEEPEYWIAAEGAVIDGPLPLRDVAARFAVGHYPADAMIKDNDPKSIWVPLTSAALRSPVRTQDPDPISLPPPVATQQTLPDNGMDGGDVMGILIIIASVIAIVIILNMDVGVDSPTPHYPNSPGPEFRIANLHAMHRQSLYLMTAIASLITGILIATRRR